MSVVAPVTGGAAVVVTAGAVVTGTASVPSTGARRTVVRAGRLVATIVVFVDPPRETAIATSAPSAARTTIPSTVAGDPARIRGSGSGAPRCAPQVRQYSSPADAAPQRGQSLMSPAVPRATGRRSGRSG